MSCSAAIRQGFKGDCSECPFTLQFCIDNNKVERDTTIVKLTYEGLTPMQIANRVGLKTKTVKSKLKGYAGYTLDVLEQY